MKQNITYLAGLDIGSTTAKLVLMDESRQLIFIDTDCNIYIGYC